MCKGQLLEIQKEHLTLTHFGKSHKFVGSLTVESNLRPWSTMQVWTEIVPLPPIFLCFSVKYLYNYWMCYNDILSLYLKRYLCRRQVSPTLDYDQIPAKLNFMPSLGAPPPKRG